MLEQQCFSAYVYTTPQRIRSEFSRHLSARHECLNAYAMSGIAALLTRTSPTNIRDDGDAKRNARAKKSNGRLSETAYGMKYLLQYSYHTAVSVLAKASALAASMYSGNASTIPGLRLGQL